MIEHRRMERRVAFVAGATGYTGSAVVPALVGAGVQVIAHVRPESPRATEYTRRFESVGAVVDLTPWGEIATAVATHRPTMVFALLGTTKARGKAAATAGRVEDYETVDYGLTIELLNAAAALRPAPLFVYLSSLGAERPGGNAYLSARHRVESALRESGVPYLVVRPSLITGDNREEERLGETLAAPVLGGALAVAKLLGARKTYEKYRAMTNGELAHHMVAQALAPYDGPRVLEPEALRASPSGRES